MSNSSVNTFFVSVFFFFKYPNITIYVEDSSSSVDLNPFGLQVFRPSSKNNLGH